MNKLVRDKIPEIIRTYDRIPRVRIARKDEFRKLLQEKLLEEVKEMKRNVSEEEIADIIEVVYSIIKTEGFSKNKIEKLRIKKAKEKGSFNKRIILERVKF